MAYKTACMHKMWTPNPRQINIFVFIELGIYERVPDLPFEIYENFMRMGSLATASIYIHKRTVLYKARPSRMLCSCTVLHVPK